MRSFLKAHILRWLNGRGIDLTWGPTLIDFLNARDVDRVIDVGANTGQFANGLRIRGFTGLINSFEPVSSVYAELVKNAGDDDKWSTENLAIGAQSGTAQINVSEDSVFSSIRQTSHYADEFDPHSQVTRIENVKVKSLDELFAGNSCKRTFLKIDTQGFEEEVLKGAEHILEEIAGVSLELPIVHLYSGVWSFTSAIEYMDRCGFVPAQIRPVTRMSEDFASVVEFDCVFRRVQECK